MPRSTLRIAAAVAALATASPVPGQLSCLGDCAGDGIVGIEDLVVGVSAVLDDPLPAACGAWDPDGNRRVTVYDLVGGIATALDGACQIIPDTLLQALDPVWETACGSLGGPISREDTVTASQLNLHCELQPRHDVHLVLRGYGPGSAPSAFEYLAGPEATEIALEHDVPARYEVQYPTQPDGVIRRTLVWRLDCWVGILSSVDELSSSLAPLPTTLAPALIDAAGGELSARCASFAAAAPSG